MKPLERYRPTLTEYEGVADLTFSQEPEIAYKGYFQAKQLTTGGIAIGFVPIVHDSGGAATIAFTLHSKTFVSWPGFERLGYYNLWADVRGDNIRPVGCSQ